LSTPIDIPKGPSHHSHQVVNKVINDGIIIKFSPVEVGVFFLANIFENITPRNLALLNELSTGKLFRSEHEPGQDSP